MSYTITNRCIACNSCLPQCPTGAIKAEGDKFWIDPTLCNNCQGYYPEPQCVVCCPTNSPIPLQAKKGRVKIEARPLTSPDLFINGKTTPFASAIVVWELCNILVQRQQSAWESDAAGHLVYQRQVNQGRSSIGFQITAQISEDQAIALEPDAARPLLQALDIRAACMHLIYAAHASKLDQPWEQEFVINDRQIEEYLGLEKRKDLSKVAKLTLIKELAQQPCRFTTSIDWPGQGKIPAFSLSQSRIWHLLGIQHHFQEDAQGCRHLVGLTFRVRAGLWTQQFLNRQGCQSRTAFYQYGSLPRSVLVTVMSIWQQHEGAARLLLWLLFKTKMGRQQRITVPTLMRVAYGEEKVFLANSDREERKRLLRTFESDLEVLHHYGLKPVFDPVSYPPEIQPFWAKLSEIPEDAEAALEFWMNDASSSQRLTDASPRGKWSRLMNARILAFDLPAEWEPLTKLKKKKQHTHQHKPAATVQPSLSGEQITTARKKRRLSQRALADMIGKSQSWIRDIENGRFHAKSEDRELLQKALGML